MHYERDLACKNINEAPIDQVTSPISRRYFNYDLCEVKSLAGGRILIQLPNLVPSKGPLAISKKFNVHLWLAAVTKQGGLEPNPSGRT
jgi:hypothetical protein